MSEGEQFYLSRRATRARRKRFSRARLINRLIWLMIILLTGALAGCGFWWWRHWPVRPVATPAAVSLEATQRELRDAPASFLPQELLGPRQKIVVHIPSRTLDWYKDGKLVKTYPVAVGRRDTPSPIGLFTVFQKEVNPRWYPPRGSRSVASGPDNPLGYRWLGFAPLYGIHGTNAPQQIGGVVSNGCIRMQERDVEELFEQVPYETPVRIVYELLKLTVAADGRLSIGAYEDVYGWRGGASSEPEVAQQLTGVGLNGFFNAAQRSELLRQSAGKQLEFARLHGLRVNGKAIAGSPVTLRGSVWTPVRPIAAALGQSLTWDAATGQIVSNGVTVPARLSGDVAYVTLEAASKLWGGLWLWRESDNVWDLIVPNVER